MRRLGQTRSIARDPGPELVKREETWVRPGVTLLVDFFGQTVGRPERRARGKSASLPTLIEHPIPSAFGPAWISRVAQCSLHRVSPDFVPGMCVSSMKRPFVTQALARICTTTSSTTRQS